MCAVCVCVSAPIYRTVRYPHETVTRCAVSCRVHVYCHTSVAAQALVCTPGGQTRTRYAVPYYRAMVLLPHAAPTPASPIRSAPFLADADVEALCRLSPPGGLLGGSIGANATAVPRGETSDTPFARCSELASALRRGSDHYRGALANCAVVGSAGSLRHSGLGAAIDRHTAVFRINLAPVAGFEADVGRHTTFRVATHYPWRILASSHRPSLTAGGVILLLYCHNTYVGKCHGDVLKPQWWMQGAKPLLLNPLLAAAMMNGRPQIRPKNPAPSSGLIAVAAAFNMCGNVTLFGFSDGSSNEAGHCRYYWDCRANVSAYRGAREHDWHHQSSLLAAMVDQGAVTPGHST